MPIPSEIGYTFRVRAPAVLERGRAYPSRMETRNAGSLVAPSSGTYTLVGPTGATVSTGAVTVASSVATYTVPAIDLPSTLVYGGGYTEEWDLLVSGVTRTARRPAYLARRALYCPVTQADLEALYPYLSTTQSTDAANLQSYLDEAWADCLQRLHSAGTWPEAVVDVDALREPVRELALSYVFRALALGSTQGRWREDATDHKAAHEAAWARVTTRHDLGQDGTPDSPDRSGALGHVTRNGAPPYIYAGAIGGRVVI